jgi:Cys-rich protein (TIGR01571 family)
MATVIGEDATGADKFDHNIPIGKWRDGVFDCCCNPNPDLARGHSLVLTLSWFCFPIALGQVMTRLHLDWLGSSMTIPSSCSTFKILVVSCFLWLAMDNGLSIITETYTYTQLDEDLYTTTPVPYWAVVLNGIRRSITYAYGLYLLIVMIRARSYLRSKYAIPEQYCTGCEDCCCSFWCHCCVVAQMARHLNDYEHNEASCCTDTGLDPHII